MSASPPKPKGKRSADGAPEEEPKSKRRPPVVKTTTTSIHKTTTMLLDERDALKALGHSTAVSLGKSNLRRNMTMPAMVPTVPCRYPSRLVVVRHGQSAQNVALDLLEDDIDTLSGMRDADIPLTDYGREQAMLTGKHLNEKDYQFDICFTSPYVRAMDTAKGIVGQLDYDVSVFSDNRLREKEFGRLHGLRASDVRTKYPEEFEMRQRDGFYWYRFPNGENYPDCELRVQAFLDSLADYAGRNVLVVTHQVPYKMIRAVLHHLDEEGVRGLEAVHNCGMQEWQLSTVKRPEGRLKLMHFNEVAYGEGTQDESSQAAAATPTAVAAPTVAIPTAAIGEESDTAATPVVSSQ